MRPFLHENILSVTQIIAMSFDRHYLSRMNQAFYLEHLPTWHPVKNYFQESSVLKTLIDELISLDPKNDPQKFYNIFNHLCEIEKRFARKENQLFPYLEKHGWLGPSNGMWAFHDSIRQMLKDIRIKIESHDFSDLQNLINYTLSEIKRLMQVEEIRLFPNSLDLVTEDEWKEMSLGEEEIGFVSQTKFEIIENNMKSDLHDNVKSSAQNLQSAFLKMQEGSMNLEQINLMLQFIPFDLTFVDENDRVLFYNRGEHRVFPRSAGVIGREVRFCHPPKSVHTVLKILEEFKNGNKDDAEFWIQFKGRMIHIRYFAIRDKNKAYKGVIEVSQDITDIQKLSGEKRLLSWD